MIAGVALDRRLQRVDRRMVGREARHAQDRRVAEEDLRERLADDRLDAEPREALRRVLARRAAAEVAVDDEDARAGVAPDR